MSVNLITGQRGKAHVSAKDIARQNKSMYGSDDVVMNEGNVFAYTIQSNNAVRVKDGIALMQGRWVCIDSGTYEDATIATGSAGTYRNDLIMLKYSKDSSGYETASIEVLQGTAGASGADPTYTKGDIDDGDTTAYMPLYRVVLNGINIESVTKLFSTAANVPLITYGTTAPSDSDGMPNGSIYIQYEA